MQVAIPGSAEGAEKNFLVDILFHRMSVVAIYRQVSDHVIRNRWRIPPREPLSRFLATLPR